MASSFQVAVSGMLAQQDKMSVIGNNIANSRTTGFKASSLTFTEEFVSQGGQFINGTLNQFGNGVKSSGVNVDWGDGAIEPTSMAANIAIAGAGFFPVVYQDELHYTRAGDFAIVADPNDPNQFFFQRPNGAVLVGNNPTNVDPPVIEATPEKPVAANFVTFRRVSGDGAVLTPADDELPGYGAAPSSFEIGPDGTISALPIPVSTADGGPISGIEVVNPLVATQQFNNPDSLMRIEGGLYRKTSLTSVATLIPEQPGQGSAGTLVQGALENSNVDLVTEFTSMIITQRSFQANSKTITTADEMMQTVMNLKR